MQFFFTALTLTILFASPSVAENFVNKIHPAPYAAQSTEQVAIIVEFGESAPPDRQYLREMGCETGHELRALHGISAECPASVLENIADDKNITYV